tara:strand:- start:1978 stop:2538 length:561 start_codon:yes stop_codon:yes gene_type:complete
MSIYKTFIKISFFILLVLPLANCGSGFFKPDWSKVAEPDGRKRAKTNVEEGRGMKLFDFKNKGGDFMFASSNPLWRASFEILDFMPFANVDYAGGMIITDWYSDNNANESIKISIRFLSNEIRADGLDVIIHKRTCSNVSCKVRKIEDNLAVEIKDKILRTAAKIDRDDKKKIRKNKRPEKTSAGD